MNVIVTGGAGFIGSHLVEHLLTQANTRVTVLDAFTYAGNRDNLQPFLHHPRLEIVEGNICHLDTLRTLLARVRPEAIVHLAAESHVDRSISSPAPFVETNISGTFCLLEAALDYWKKNPSLTHSFRFLHVSTDEVYGTLEPHDPPFTESHPYRPRSPYAASKAAADHLVRAWHETHRLPVLISHACNNYGPRQFPEKLIPVVVRSCRRRSAIPVYGTGKNVRDWIHVVDNCRALLAILLHGNPGRSYNIGAHNEIPNIDLVHHICSIADDLSGIPPHSPNSHHHLISFVTDRPGHDFRYAIDPTRLHRETGWTPRIAFDTGLRQTVEWYWNPTA